MIKRLVLAAGFAALSAAPALAVDSSKTVEIKAAPDKVWRVIGDFCGIEDWHPAVEKCEIDKKDPMMRTLTLKGGGAIVEKQTARDDAKMTYSYVIVESPLPVANYKSTIRVTKAGAGSKVSWMGSYKAKGASAEEAKKTIDGVYDAGLQGIATGSN
jgi:carbon monoxide dehydrogenase subunit G